MRQPTLPIGLFLRILLFGFWITGCGGGEGPPTVTDTAPPHILSLGPAPGEASVPPDVALMIAFDEPIDWAAAADHFTLTSSAGEIIALKKSCNTPCTVVTLIPQTPLEFNRVYQVGLDGITDLTGNPLSDPITWSFKTRPAPGAADSTPPHLLSTSPAEGMTDVDGEVVITLLFDEAIDLNHVNQMGNNFNQNLHAVDATSPERAWAVGDRGAILNTSDGGATWRLQESGTSHPVYGVDFTHPQIGFAVGGTPAGGPSSTNVILKTADGGTRWTSQTIQGLPGILKSVHFINDQKGWAVGRVWLLKTENGGATWNTHFMFPSPIKAIDFIDSLNGWAVGEAGTLLSTSDGGASWNATSITTLHLYGIAMTSSRTGWAVGDKGTLLYFDGTGWSLQSSATRIPLKGVTAMSDTSAWAVGNYGVITRSSSGGNGIIQNQMTTTELFGPFFVDNQTGWTVGSDARIFRTIDGGKTWTQQIKNWKTDIQWTHLQSARLCNKNPDGSWAEDPATGIPGVYQCIRTTKVNLFNLFFLTPKRGWVIGLPSLILYTDNGGATWTEQNFDPYAEDCYDCAKAGIYLRRVQFNQNGMDGWAIGRFRTIYRTNDGGTHWKLLSNNWTFPTRDGTCTTPSGKILTRMGGHLFGLSVNPDNPKDVWVAGGCCKPCNPEAIIAHTTDGGVNWDVRTSYIWDSNVANRPDPSNPFLPEIGRFHAIQMRGDAGWVAGRGGFYMQTQDRGVTWRQIPVGMQETLTDLFFIDQAHGWLVGWMGTLLKSTDGGQNRRPSFSGTRNDLLGVQFFDTQQGWIAGSGELILHTQTGG